ncbi:hypothetical protein EV177_005264 [Coemansia sp. RSA 1804]|nr:hypothetical protein EV177_005264 [Coemansia sp. RSA 1804]
MDYRDPDGYFKDEVYMVLGREAPASLASSVAGSSSSGPEAAAADEALPPPRYGWVSGSNFEDNEKLTRMNWGSNGDEDGMSDITTTTDTTSTGITVSSSGSDTTTTDTKKKKREKKRRGIRMAAKFEDDDVDEEWEEAKRVLQTVLVGLLVPMVFRFVGRRMTFSVWTRILKSYFSL